LIYDADIYILHVHTSERASDGNPLFYWEFGHWAGSGYVKTLIAKSAYMATIPSPHWIPSVRVTGFSGMDPTKNYHVASFRSGVWRNIVLSKALTGPEIKMGTNVLRKVNE